MNAQIEADGTKTSYEGEYVICVEDAEAYAKLKDGFYIEEYEANGAGWTYSDAKYHVVYNDARGDWDIFATDVNGDDITTETLSEATFVNSYDATGVSLDEFEINFTKTVVGEDAPAEEFTFIVTDVGGVSIPHGFTGEPHVTCDPVETSAGEGDNDGSVLIEGSTEQILEAKQAGILIREHDDGEEGWTYSDRVYKLMYDEDGELEDILYHSAAEGMVSGQWESLNSTNMADIVFTNVYGEEEHDFEPYEITVPLSKTVSLAEGVSTAPNETFTFELFDFGTQDIDESKFSITGNTISTTGAQTTAYTGTLKITAEDMDTFFDLTEGFYLREKPGADSDWTYSDAVYHVISVGGGEWAIQLVKKIDGDYVLVQEPAERTVAEFTNIYNGESGGGGEDNPGGGEDNPGGGEDNPGGGEDNPGGGEDNPGGGEDNPGGGEDNPGGGEDNPGGGEDNPGGGYTPDYAQTTVTAFKTLNGYAPLGSEFSFVLKDAWGNVVQTKHNNGSVVTFSPLTFYGTGTYVYTISEVKGTDSSIRYDGSVYTVSIRVEKDSFGDYYVHSVSYQKDGKAYTGTPTFANITTAIDNIPKTGDDSNTGLWLTLMLVSLALLGATVVYGKKFRPASRRGR